MNGVVSQFHKDYPAYAKTKVKVVWVPWTNATSDFNTNAAAIPNLAGSAGTGLGANTFDWGLPFFYGRSVYVVFEGRTASGSSLVGPYVAF